MEHKQQNDILDEQIYPIIRNYSLLFLEVLICAFTIISIGFVFVPITYEILIANDTPPTDGDKIGLFILLILSIIQLIPFCFVLLFVRTSCNKYVDKTTAFEPSYFGLLQQYSNYAALVYIVMGVLLSFTYGFSDHRTIYTLSMFMTGLVIANYTNRTREYVKTS